MRKSSIEVIKSQTIKSQRDHSISRDAEKAKQSDVLLEKLLICDLTKQLKDPLLAYFHNSSAENFKKVQSKLLWLLEMRKMLLKAENFEQSEDQLAKISLFVAVVKERGTSEQQAQINFQAIVKQALADLGHLGRNWSLSEFALVAVKWDEWLLHNLPESLRVNSPHGDRPESICAMLSCLLIHHAVGQQVGISHIVSALLESGLDLLQMKGKRVNLKAWLDDIFSKKSGFDWRKHREIQDSKCGSTFTLAELYSFFEHNQPLLVELRDIVKLDGHLEALKKVDYLKRPEEKEIDVILVQMEAIADTLSERAVPKINRYWRERSMNALMFYSGILFTLKNPRWKIELKKQETIRQRVIDKIKAVELQLLIGINAQRRNKHLWSNDSRYLKKIENFRKKAKEQFKEIVTDKISTDTQRLQRAQKLDAFSYAVVEFIKNFMGLLVEACIADFGPVPCDYSFIGFGSFEKNSMTPYSDLEFAILIQVDTLENREYFRNLSYLLMTRIIQLGETPIPITLFDYSFDHLTNRGFSFDLGGKTSLGRNYDENQKQDSGKRYGELKYELIDTPERMIRYIEDEYFEVDTLLPVELCQCAFICGDRGLASQYEALLMKRMHEKDSKGVPFYQRRAVTYLQGNNFLKGDLDTYSGKFDGSNDFQLCDVKQEIYRLPDRLISDLALFYGHINGSIAEKIEGLLRAAVISKDQAENLRILDGVAKELRLQAYFYYGRQYEGLSILPRVFKEEGSVYKVDDLQNIELFYHIAYAFQQQLKNKIIKKIDLTKDMMSVFRNQKFRDYSLMVSAKIARRLNNQDKVQQYIMRLKNKQKEKSNYILADLYDELGASFFSTGNYKDAQENWKIYLQALVQQGDDFSAQQATTIANLASTYGALGEWEEEKSLLKKALVMLQACPGSQQKRTAFVLMRLGMAYGQCGDWKNGIAYLERAVEIDQNYYQIDTLRAAERIGNLGGAYGAIGNWRRAINLQESALSILEECYGPDHAEVAILLGNLGESYGALGDRNRQLQSQLRALKIQEAVYGTMHIELALPLTRLGNTYGSMGQWRTALDLQMRALEIKRSEYGIDNTDVAVTLESMGNCYGALRDWSMQLRCQQEASDIYHKCCGPTHSYFAQAQVKLGNAFGALGNRKKQIELQENAQEILQNIYEGDHADLAFVLTSLGCGYGALNDWDKQIELQERALSMYAKVYGPDHDQVVSTLINLGSAYGFKGLNQKQIELQERAMEIQHRHFGATSPEVALTRVNLASAYGALGGWKNQLVPLEQAARILEDAYGAEHAEMVTILLNLSYACEACGDMQRSQDLQKRAQAIKQMHSGGNYFTDSNQLSAKNAKKVLVGHLNEIGHFGLANKSKITIIHHDEGCKDSRFISVIKK